MQQVFSTKKRKRKKFLPQVFNTSTPHPPLVLQPVLGTGIGQERVIFHEKNGNVFKSGNGYMFPQTFLVTRSNRERERPKNGLFSGTVRVFQKSSERERNGFSERVATLPSHVRPVFLPQRRVRRALRLRGSRGRAHSDTVQARYEGGEPGGHARRAGAGVEAGD